MKRSLTVLLAIALLSVAGGAFALPIGGFPLIIADENGHSVITFGGPPASLFFAVTSDPGPGGQADVLTYDLGGPPALVAGDLFLTGPVGSGVSDLVRFDPAGTGGIEGYPASFLIYTDQDTKTPSLAGTPFPTQFYANQLTLPELGTTGDAGIFYTPSEDQPGFVPTYDVTYIIFTQGNFAGVPEPSPAAAFGIGGLCFVGLAFAARRRNRATAVS